MPRLILIIEDTASLAASLALALEKIDDVEVVMFGNGRDALAYLGIERRPLAAIVTDLNLPDDDGFALIRKIRQIDNYRGLPAILITAQESPMPHLGDILGSPNAIVKKPFLMKEVRLVLETLL